MMMRRYIIIIVRFDDKRTCIIFSGAAVKYNPNAKSAVEVSAMGMNYRKTLVGYIYILNIRESARIYFDTAPLCRAQNFQESSSLAPRGREKSLPRIQSTNKRESVIFSHTFPTAHEFTLAVYTYIYI